jgi:hypothetical protein
MQLLKICSSLLDASNAFCLGDSNFSKTDQKSNAPPLILGVNSTLYAKLSLKACYKKKTEIFIEEAKINSAKETPGEDTFLGDCGDYCLDSHESSEWIRHVKWKVYFYETRYNQSTVYIALRTLCDERRAPLKVYYC